MTAVRVHAAVVLAYVALALFVTWPLPLHLSTHLTGMPSGDTGVYVWNLWVFGHEIAQGRLPFYTSAILNVAPTLGPVNLSLHNYTTFANVLALPLVPRVGLVASFNLIYIINIALTGYASYLQMRYLEQRHAESWLAGALFAASPVLISRGVAHFSLVAAAPLCLFGVMLSRTMRFHLTRDAVLTGLIIAWAAFCDAYYAVYCLLIAGYMLIAYTMQVRRPDGTATRRVGLIRCVDVLLIIVGGFVVGMAIRGGGPITILGLRVSQKTLYTPVLVLSCLVLLRVLLTMRPRLHLNVSLPSATVWRTAAAGVVAMIIPLSPVLYAFGERLVTDQVQGTVYWRSSPSGVDLLAFFLPNPNHPWWGAPMQQAVSWLAHKPNGFGFPEYAASFPFVAIGLCAFAWWRAKWRPVPGPIVFTLTFAVLAMGPFVQVAGMNTHVPTPWALLRYVPIVGLAQSPSRLAIVAMMGLTCVFALALTHLTTTYPQRRRAILIIVGALMLFELSPVPRPLYSAEVPPIYRIIANDPDMTVRVLELPFGVRDGTSSLGNFNAGTQFYQTAHGKGIIGGYVSRVTMKRKHRYQRVPMLDALMTLSEGRSLSHEQEQRADATIDRFLTRARVAYVVVDRVNTSPELLSFATRTLGLSKIAASDGRDLYMARPPRSMPEPFSDPPAFLDSLPRPTDAPPPRP
jgi:hypothetical protein